MQRMGQAPGAPREKASGAYLCVASLFRRGPVRNRARLSKGPVEARATSPSRRVGSLGARRIPNGARHLLAECKCAAARPLDRRASGS
jgi:hypothetical protein